MSDAPLQGEVTLANEPYSHQPKITAAEIWEALEQAEGNIAAAARALGLTRAKLQDRIDRSPSLITMLSDIREEVVDVAETNTMRRAKSGADPVAEKFVLQTLGKRRGWNTAAGGMNGNGDITVTITRFADGAIEDQGE